MILGISAGRKGKITEQAIKTVLKSTDQKYKFYSLSDFEILTCDACLGCIENHMCVKNDNLNQIMDEIIKADALIFGASEYWNTMNAKGRAFWERVCFSTRHNKYFPFKDKPGIIIGVSGDGDSSGVINEITTFFEDARLDIISKVAVRGEYACFKCGLGHICEVGGLSDFYDIPVEKEKLIKPELDNQCPEQPDKKVNVINNLKRAGSQLTKRLK